MVFLRASRGPKDSKETTDKDKPIVVIKDQRLIEESRNLYFS